MLAIDRAKQEPLDFQQAELEVFELAVNYVFYCLRTRVSPQFGKKSKTYYRDRLRQFIELDLVLRVGSPRLSVLVEKAELSVVNGKVEIAKLVKRLEATDEV